jgi:transcriptional regulator with GAF, ATPase, and Fis domain
MVAGDLFSGDPSRTPAADARAQKLSTAELALHDKLVAELRSAGGNVALVARRLGKAPVQIRRWARRFGIDIEHLRSADDDEPGT